MVYVVIFWSGAIVLVLWSLSLYRSLVLLNENIDDAMSQIGVQLSSRWDALISILEITKAYDGNTYNAIRGISKERLSITKKSTSMEVKKQEHILGMSMRKIIEVAEDDPILKKEVTYIKIMDALHQYESMASTSRLIYNDSVGKLNRSIHTFPTFLLAKVFGFSKRTYLESLDDNYNRYNNDYMEEEVEK